MHHPQPDHHRVASARDAGIAAFAATAGALLVFGSTRRGWLSAFADVGSNVMRDIVLPYWGNAVVGLGIHLGEMILLGVATAALFAARRLPSRWLAAAAVIIVWELGALFPPFALVRADIAAELSVRYQFGIAVLLLVALSIGTRKD